MPSIPFLLPTSPFVLTFHEPNSTVPVTVALTVPMVQVTAFVMLLATAVIFSAFVHGHGDSNFKEIEKQYFNGNFWTAKRHPVPGDYRFTVSWDLCKKLGYGDLTTTIGGCAGTSLLSGCVPRDGSKDGKVPTVFLSPCPKDYTCRAFEFNDTLLGTCKQVKGAKINIFDWLNTRFYGGKFWETERLSTTGGKRYMDAGTLCQTEGYSSEMFISGCAGTDLLSGCCPSSWDESAVVFKSACPAGYSCRYKFGTVMDPGKCTKNSN